MNVREKVRVHDLPFTWSSNLDDDGLRKFYQQHRERIIEKALPAEQPSGVIHIPLRMAFLEFRGGVCLWTASSDHHTVLYRSRRDMELWNARRAEIQELRDEQAAELAAQRQLLAAEDNYLKEKTDLALTAGDYNTAARHVHARAELHVQCAEPYRMPGAWSCWRSEFTCIFTLFPTSTYGMDFIRKYDLPPQFWINFAHWYAVRRNAEGLEFEAETGRIYDEAFKLFPDWARLHQAACLFWRRRRRYELAMKICAEAIAKNLRDGTKSGFEGRLRRLEKEMNRRDASRPPVAGGG